MRVQRQAMIMEVEMLMLTGSRGKVVVSGASTKVLQCPALISHLTIIKRGFSSYATH